MSATCWVYIKSESQLYTVGFYDPAGQWQPESDHNDSEAAAHRCAWLNGAPNAVPNLEECWRG